MYVPGLDAVGVVIPVADRGEDGKTRASLWGVLEQSVVCVRHIVRQFASRK